MSRGEVDEERARATTPPRLALIITATLLGGMIAAVGMIGSNALEPGLTDAAGVALRDADISGVDVRFEGREAFLTPMGASPVQLAEAERVVEAVDGVRWATIVAPDENDQPTLTVGADSGGVVTVSGTVGSEEQAVAIQDAAVARFGPETLVDVVVDEGTASASWVASASELFAALGDVQQLSFAIDGGVATLAGAAVEPSTVEEAVAAALPGLALTSNLTQAGPTSDEAAEVDATVILFVADSVKLNAAAREKVAALAEVLLRYPTVQVRVTGHVAIPVGTEAEAVAFSERRARVVADALVAAGVDASRLDVVGAGSSDPVGDNDTEAGAAANRRVTVLIVEGS